MPVVLGMRWWQSDERRLQEERRGVKRKKKSPFFNSLLETVPLLSVPSRVAQSYWPIITTSQFPACCSLASFRFWLPLGFFCSRCFSSLLSLFLFSSTRQHSPINHHQQTTNNIYNGSKRTTRTPKEPLPGRRLPPQPTVRSKEARWRLQ